MGDWEKGDLEKGAWESEKLSKALLRKQQYPNEVMP